jgi:isopentenyl-diphosphate delta-isomerase
MTDRDRGDSLDSDGKEVIRQRKVDHLELCAREDVEYRVQTTLLEDVRLMHQSLPEISVDEVDLSTSIFGRSLSAPLCISGMTGGADRARDVNRGLATLAQEVGVAFGVGSQRAMLIDPGLADTFCVRDVAPDIVLFGNIGAVQAAESPVSAIEDIVGIIEADALCIHLNPAQELIQEEGDRDFRGCLDGIARLVETLSVPVIAKETGCGMSPETLSRLAAAGVGWVDVSGAGGTTWVGVEALRARPGRRLIGEDFWEWGIPTAASVVYAVRAGHRVIASGGVRNGHDAARALALGASLCSMALPFLRGFMDGGVEGARRHFTRVVDGLTAAMILTGSRNVEELRRAPRILGAELRSWMSG